MSIGCSLMFSLQFLSLCTILLRCSVPKTSFGPLCFPILSCIVVPERDRTQVHNHIQPVNFACSRKCSLHSLHEPRSLLYFLYFVFRLRYLRPVVLLSHPRSLCTSQVCMNCMIMRYSFGWIFCNWQSGTVWVIRVSSFFKIVSLYPLCFPSCKQGRM